MLEVLVVFKRPDKTLTMAIKAWCPFVSCRLVWMRRSPGLKPVFNFLNSWEVFRVVYNGLDDFLKRRRRDMFYLVVKNIMLSVIQVSFIPIRQALYISLVIFPLHLDPHLSARKSPASLFQYMYLKHGQVKSLCLLIVRLILLPDV